MPVPDRQQIDVALVVALDEELKTFEKMFGTDLEFVDPYYAFKFEDAEGRDRSGLVGYIGEMGNEQSFAYTERLLARYQPTVVVSVGLAGMMQDTRLGDLAVGITSWRYDGNAKVVDNKDGGWTFQPAPFGMPTSPDIVELIDRLHLSHPHLHDQWRQTAMNLRTRIGPQAPKLSAADLIGKEPRILTGPIASGPWVSASQAFKDYLLKQNRKFIAIEMESHGVVKAAFRNRPRCDSLILRAISDPADQRKSKIDDGGGVREWAMSNAYTFLATLLKKSTIFDLLAEGSEKPVPKPQAAGRVNELAARLAERHVQSPIESVAAHSIGAYIIGLFHLPEQLDGEKQYNKSVVLRTILSHDFAEAITGDLLPAQKTEDSRNIEARWFGYLAMLRTYEGISDLSGVEKDWQNFEYGKDINGRIAKELDVLDNLYQLLSYIRQGEHIADADEWKRQIVAKVKTKAGQDILGMILSHFRVTMADRPPAIGRAAPAAPSSETAKAEQD